MKIYFWSVGKSHDSYVKEGIELILPNVFHIIILWNGKFFHLQKMPLRIRRTNQKNRSYYLFNALQNDDMLVALDEYGKQWNSLELADFIQQKANESAKNIIFLIGGAYGLHESILKSCNFKWSLSKLVFPHQLVRLILAEQLYRACTIIRNEKYHHS